MTGELACGDISTEDGNGQRVHPAPIVYTPRLGAEEILLRIVWIF